MANIAVASNPQSATQVRLKVENAFASKARATLPDKALPGASRTLYLDLTHAL
jgi:hypothetical protein